jgi:hypothetical protein
MRDNAVVFHKRRGQGPAASFVLQRIKSRGHPSGFLGEQLARRRRLVLDFSSTHDFRLPFEEVLESKSKSNTIRIFGFPVRIDAKECDCLAMRAKDVLGVSDTEDMCIACHANRGHEKVYMNGLPSLNVSWHSDRKAKNEKIQQGPAKYSRENRTYLFGAA